MLHEIDSLREIARRCLAGQPLEDHHSRWLGRSLDKFLNQSCRSIEEAFGLHMPKGGIPWWREEAIRKRAPGATRRSAAPGAAPCNGSDRTGTPASSGAARRTRSGTPPAGTAP